MSSRAVIDAPSIQLSPTIVPHRSLLCDTLHAARSPPHPQAASCAAAHLPEPGRVATDARYARVARASDCGTAAPKGTGLSVPSSEDLDWVPKSSTIDHGDLLLR